MPPHLIEGIATDERGPGGACSFGLEQTPRRARNRGMTVPIRQFHAHAMVEGGHAPSATIDAHSFEEAAMTFFETWGASGAENRVTVRDNRTGEQHCFALQHDSAVAADCAA
jgi:hypothetical protein